MPTTTLDLSADIIDVRDIIDRVEELEELEEGKHLTAPELEELDDLKATLSDLQGMGGDEQWRGDWYPVTLIRDSYFRDYAEELAGDFDLIQKNAGWPMNCIDWEHAANELRHDYSGVDINGATYWTR